jgi:hypothetical protein
MEIIIHRVNTIGRLKRLSSAYGVEIDLRDRLKRLIVQHNPFKDGVDFGTYLRHYRHGTLIVNIKSERIEWKALKLLHKYRIRNYFFLDCSFPMIMELIKKGHRGIALRLSDYEKIETVLSLKGKVRWVWVDGFKGCGIRRGDYVRLKKAGFKLCLVSPDLHQQKRRISRVRKLLTDQRIDCDAVCVKAENKTLWE